MKKLNNKGYLTIEIILSAVIAFTIAFFLIEVTVNFSNASDNYYTDTIFITDKALVSDNIKKNIQNDINENGIINNVSCTNNNCTITYNDNTTKELKYNSSNKKVEYDNYSKEIKRVNYKSLSVCDSNGCSSDVTNNYTEGDYIRFVISFDNVFEKNNYDINILIYNGNTETHELLVDYITDLYDNAEKTVVTNNDIEYNYATSVGLMNDRLGGITKSLNGGNIRYYGSYVVGGVTEEESDGYIEKKNWLDLSEGNIPDMTSEDCMKLLDFSCNNYQNMGFGSMEECDLEFHRMTDMLKQEYGYDSFDDYLKDYIKESSGGKYSTVEEVCSVTKLYYKNLNNYIDIGDKYEEDFTFNNWDRYIEKFWIDVPFNDAEGCKNWAIENGATDNIVQRMTVYNSVDELCSTTTIPKGTSILYRIIGVFDGKVRVRRDTGIGFYSYDTSSLEVNYGNGINEWSQADLMKLLNPGYENNQDQVCKNCYYNAYNNKITGCECTDNTYVNNSLWYNSENGDCYNDKQNIANSCNFKSMGLSKTVQDKIVDQEIYFGSLDGDFTLEQVYSNERNNWKQNESFDTDHDDRDDLFITREQSWIGKVALPYASDFGYAVDFRYCNNTKISNRNGSCGPSYYDCADYNWMSTGASWSISYNYYSSLIIQERVLFREPSLEINSWPVLTLDPSLRISGGTGAKNNPYLLEGVTFVPGEINIFEQSIDDIRAC